uniref:Uncharacterized protein n=1 Tax=Anguilla anguilla TaxID=7936 RepID=A0A0E9QNQ9_ANGAN
MPHSDSPTSSIVCELSLNTTGETVSQGNV